MAAGDDSEGADTQPDDAPDFRADDGAHDEGEALPSDATCSMQGLWAVRMTTYNQSLATSVVANWYYLEITQEGEAFEVVDSLDCGYGMQSVGASGITSAAAIDAFSAHNSQVGRRGTSARSGSHCDLAFARFWSVRGANEASYLPEGHDDARSIDELREAVPLPSAEHSSGQEDWDHDGKPGVSLLIGSNDARYSTSRDWSEWYTCNGGAADPDICFPGDEQKYALAPGQLAGEIDLRANVDSEENCLGASSSLYAAPGMPLVAEDNRVRLKFLGADRSAALAHEFWSAEDAEERCAMVRRLLPGESK
jgi:hypothetical protein